MIRLRTLLPAALAAALLAPAARGCPVCFGDTESASLRGLNPAIFLLLGTTYFVVGGFAGMFIYMRRRARRAPGSASEDTLC